MNRIAVALFVFSVLLSTSKAHAQWAVFDSTNYANAVKEFRQVERLYTTANETRDQIVEAYNLAHRMAEMPQDLYRKYSADFASWKTLNASNTYGNTSQWIFAANGQSASAAAGYETAGVQLIVPSSSALIGLDDRSQALIKTQYATAELADGVAVNQLNTVGEIRARSAALSQQINNLASDSYSNDPAQQTEMAVLAKINAATLMQLRSQQDTNQLLATGALQQLLTAKEQADQQKRALNLALYFQQNFKDSKNRITSGMTESLGAISFASH